MHARLISTDGKQLTIPRKPQTVKMLTEETLPITRPRSILLQLSPTTESQPTALGKASASSLGLRL